MGSRFHADIHVPSSAAADAANADGTLRGGVLLYDPRGGGALITHLRIATDQAARICVGLADQDSQRIMAAPFAANGGVATAVCFEVPPGGRLYVLRSAQANVDVAIDGQLLPAP